MSRENLEALIVYATGNLPGNVQYFSNYAPFFVYGAPSVIMVASEKNEAPLLLFDSAIDYTTVSQTKLQEKEGAFANLDVRLSPDYAKAIAEHFKKGHVEGRVGIVGMSALPAPLYQKLTASMPSVDFQDAQSLVDELRMIKSPTELELMRKSAGIADKGIETGLNAISEGKTEHDVAVAADHAMRMAGAETFSFPTCVGAGLRALLIKITPGATSAVIKNHDLVMIDLGARCDGYCSDISRTGVCGRPTGKQKDLFEIVLQIYRKAFDTVRPGVMVHEVHEAAEQAAKEAGYTLVPPIGGGPVGHGVGLELNDVPRRPSWLREGAEVKIAPGMTFTLEPGIYLPDVGGVRLEDTVLAVEAGAESLTKSDMQLF